MLSKYRITHVWVNFTVTPETRKRFIRALKIAGFMRFDTNTYFAPFIPKKVDSLFDYIERITPRAATVRVWRITDMQWTDARVFIGKD
jgi:hypothetical protein